MGRLTPEELIDRLDRLEQFEARLQAATDGTETPAPHHDPPPPDRPTLESAIRTQEQIVTRLERAITDTPPSRQGTTDYSRLLTNLRESTEYLASLRARLAETDSTDTTEGTLNSFHGQVLIALLIGGLTTALHQGTLTPETFSLVWQALVDAGVCEVARVDPSEAFPLYESSMQGQRDLDAEEAAKAVPVAT